MTVDAIARALGLGRAGRQYAGKCPSCGYKSGFTLAERRGAILLCCHAGGCSQAELWAALKQAGIAASGDHGGSSERRNRLSTAAVAGGSQAAALAIWRR